MGWIRSDPNDFITSRWSGGTTTQLAIEPEGAVYDERDFLWRLSSARVESDTSTFTPLPDYDRLLAVLQGEIRLKVGADAPVPLDVLQVCSFDGNVPVKSWGRCVDFNLMLRKGVCEGEVKGVRLPPGSSCIWPETAPGAYSRCTLAVYCVEGEVSAGGCTARGGELLMCRDAARPPVELSSRPGGTVMAVAVYRR